MSTNAKSRTSQRRATRAKCGELPLPSTTHPNPTAPSLTARWKILRFGEDSVEKMVDWAAEHVPLASRPFVLEVGSGNGALLFALSEAGYNASRLAGIDYSPDAVTLARLVAANRGAERITFSVCDFLADVPASLDGQPGWSGAWDLLLDKGTYDAIALGEKDEDGKSPVSGYPARVAALLKPGGHFLITCTCSL